MRKFKYIILVEDDPQDIELTLTALGKHNLANDVVVTHDVQAGWIISTAEVHLPNVPRDSLL